MTMTLPTMMFQLSVHYENNNPFLVVTRLERTVELSMWGNIAVEEVMKVAHFDLRSSIMTFFPPFALRFSTSGTRAPPSRAPSRATSFRGKTRASPL